MEDARRYFDEGNWGDGLLSLIGLVPIGGDAIKWGKKSIDALGTARTLVRVGEVAVDSSVVIRGLDGGQVKALDAALSGRAPVISITAAKEYLRNGDTDVLRDFLVAKGGRVGAAGSEALVGQLRSQAKLLNRVLHVSDARVAGSAITEGLTLGTNDRRLFNFLSQAGFKVELWDLQ